MNLEIHTERLLLTPYAMSDLDIAVEIWTDPEVLKYICEPADYDTMVEEMPNAIKRGGNGGIGIWCINDPKSGEKLGEAYILPMPVEEDDIDYSLIVMGQMPDVDIEIGYFLKPSAWGKGYATEVCKQLLRFAFEKVMLDEVVASVNDENLASKSVLEKSGLTDRGRARCWGEISPIYRITRDEWSEFQKSN